MEKRNAKKAKLLYDAIDASGGYYVCPIEKASRSKMNVMFRVAGGNEELEKKFAKEATAAKLVGTRRTSLRRRDARLALQRRLAGRGRRAGRLHGGLQAQERIVWHWLSNGASHSLTRQVLTSCGATPRRLFDAATTAARSTCGTGLYIRRLGAHLVARPPDWKDGRRNQATTARRAMPALERSTGRGLKPPSPEVCAPQPRWAV